MEPLCLDDLDDSALDRLPFGVVRLSAEGTVERFNRAESERSGIASWRAVGRDYFGDVNVLNQDWKSFVDAVVPGDRTRVYAKVRGYHRADDAVIDISRCEAGRVYLCIRATGRQA